MICPKQRPSLFPSRPRRSVPSLKLLLDGGGVDEVLQLGSLVGLAAPAYRLVALRAAALPGLDQEPQDAHLVDVLQDAAAQARRNHRPHVALLVAHSAFTLDDISHIPRGSRSSFSDCYAESTLRSGVLMMAEFGTLGKSLVVAPFFSLEDARMRTGQLEQRAPN